MKKIITLALGLTCTCFISAVNAQNPCLKENSSCTKGTYYFKGNSNETTYKKTGQATYFGADLQFENNSGRISKIHANGPADNFNFRKDDVIKAIGDFSITSSNDLEKALAYYKGNDEVQVKYVRDGEERARIVVLEKVDVYESVKKGS